MKTLVKLFKLAYEIKDAIEQIKKEQIDAVILQDKDALLSVRRAAMYLDTTERAVRELIRKREISAYIPTENRKYITRSSLDAFMRRGESISKYEIERIAYLKNRKNHK